MAKASAAIYSLIVILGLIVFTSFVQFRIGEWDWPFFIISISFVVVSTIVEHLLISAIVSRNAKVVSARLAINDAYQRIEDAHKWDEYKQSYVQEHTITSFYWAYHCYAFTNDYWIEKRPNVSLNQKQFKESFLSKGLKADTAKEKMKLTRRLRMLHYQKDQDNVEHIDRARMAFKRGHYLGKPATDYFKGIVSVIVETTSFGLSIFSMIRFNETNPSSLIYKLLILFIFIVADSYFVYSNVKSEIGYWIELAEATKELTEVLFGERESNITKTPAYYEFNNPSSN